jgi:hypothetical protein
VLRREELIVGERELTHTRSFGPLRTRSAYDLAAIEDVRADDPRSSYWTYGIGTGAVAFGYGRRTVRVADVDEAEAKRVVDALAAASVS